MARVTYVEHSGRVHAIEVRKGTSVMEGAVKNNIPGIDAECGGNCSCGTCHVMIGDGWLEAVGAPGAIELGMLDIVPDRRPNSRLSCQIKVLDALDGLVVHLPERQR